MEFDNFEATFRNLINNGNLDEGGKLAYLMHNLQGEAKEFIGRDGLAEKTYEDVPKQEPIKLKEHTEDKTNPRSIPLGWCKI